jgi:hypothetical protein
VIEFLVGAALFALFIKICVDKNWQAIFGGLLTLASAIGVVYLIGLVLWQKLT